MAVYEDDNARTLPGGDTGVGQPWYMYDPKNKGGGAPGTGTGGGGGIPGGDGGGPYVPPPGTDGITATGPGLIGGGAAASWFSALGPLGWAMLGLGIFGTIFDIVGNMKSAGAQKDLADFNARMAEMRAADALNRGQDEVIRFRQGMRVLLGTQKAGYAGQNVDVGVGSPVDVAADTAFLAELDVAVMKANAKREAWGYQVEAENYRRGGAIVMTAAKWGAASTALTAGSSIAASIYGWGRS